MKPVPELILPLQPPALLSRRTGKPEGEFLVAGRTIRRAAIGNGNLAGGRELIRRQGDADFVGVPAIEHDRVDLISQEPPGRLPTGQRRIAERNERFEIRIGSSRQGDQNVVGDSLEPLVLRRERLGFGVRRRRGSRIFTGNA